MLICMLLSLLFRSLFSTMTRIHLLLNFVIVIVMFILVLIRHNSKKYRYFLLEKMQVGNELKL